ncbi:tRNA (adenosine(37)-N6)-dimethylallyltransferase MiaA [Proteiniclasticum sp.]|uniref:tRNA (adenosine(37)-N6)-dimethylallyltransferase MiaA n=1 Tax=Proteiniclasticum sp. TaxID=2053595 RepID=UPI00289E0CDC|nr:tRNA (adenosine(37)-N6)-dimethylallyltransferase MiaA [Proteiniclasticum sp.]
MKNTLIIIAGPTGVGKTEISLELAERTGGEIISCDSMQIYEGMDIGSAKADEEERRRVVHHMIDVVTPFDPFTVSDYKEAAEKAIDEILSRGKVPIMVGGTGLYIDAVIKDLSFTEGGNDQKYREAIEVLARTEGNEEVHRMLASVDPEAAEKIHPNNLKRVIRALEVQHVTGKPFSSFKDTGRLNPKYDVHYFYLNKNRKDLYEGIDRRVEIMMDMGLLDEIRRLKASGLDESYVSMKGIGYKEMLSYLDGECSLEEAKDLVKQRSRNYAKRQLTWFRHNEYATELSKDQYSDEEILIILEKYANGWYETR